MERKSNAKADKWYPLGTIAHVEGNRTTLNAALKKMLNTKSEDNQEDKKKINDCIENTTKKRSYSYVDCEGVDAIYLPKEECLTKALKDIQIEDISKNNKLVLSPKQYGQQLKKKGQHYGKKN